MKKGIVKVKTSQYREVETFSLLFYFTLYIRQYFYDIGVV